MIAFLISLLSVSFLVSWVSEPPTDEHAEVLPALIFLKQIDESRFLAARFRPASDDEAATWSVSVRDGVGEQLLLRKRLASAEHAVMPPRHGRPVRVFDAMAIDKRRIIVVARVDRAVSTFLLTIPEPGSDLAEFDVATFAFDSDTGKVVDQAMSLLADADGEVKKVAVLFRYLDSNDIQRVDLTVRGSSLDVEGVQAPGRGQ